MGFSAWGWDGNEIFELELGWGWDSKLGIDWEWDGIGNDLLGMGFDFEFCRALI